MMPIWVRPDGPEAAYDQVNISKAVRHGLTFRSLSETTRATLAWFNSQTKERQLRMRAGLRLQREAEVLAAWHGRKQNGKLKS
jgi:2'-hydroxyisoflavone reductase